MCMYVLVCARLWCGELCCQAGRLSKAKPHIQFHNHTSRKTFKVEQCWKKQEDTEIQHQRQSQKDKKENGRLRLCKCLLFLLRHCIHMNSNINMKPWVEFLPEL